MNKKRKHDCIEIEEEYYAYKKQKIHNEYEDKINELFLKNEQLEYEVKILKENYENLSKQVVSLKNKIYYYNNIPSYIS